ncbi:hypothetical protein BDP55DRAFT_760956 [Colletotrichum godetiae]|uniref:Uncharacterized protein n=1 Tax=Colletotrichum godetiae TaxID=1209918 RepID=A0AAJ0A857_9PEZI|nr:uncharacterized protein BDP55DRAFT_760956 [Colletotrichum godetiae]KAK1657653.1 hypothetical protein BDP55DRAFT_760956 [Colletotrichum godetiae]
MNCHTRWPTDHTRWPTDHTQYRVMGRCLQPCGVIFSFLLFAYLYVGCSIVCLLARGFTARAREECVIGVAVKEIDKLSRRMYWDRTSGGFGGAVGIAQAIRIISSPPSLHQEPLRNVRRNSHTRCDRRGQQHLDPRSRAQTTASEGGYPADAGADDLAQARASPGGRPRRRRRRRRRRRGRVTGGDGPRVRVPRAPRAPRVAGRSLRRAGVASVVGRGRGVRYLVGEAFCQVAGGVGCGKASTSSDY